MKIDFYLPTDKEEVQEILNTIYDAGYRWQGGTDLRDVNYITGITGSKRVEVLCFNTELKRVTWRLKKEHSDASTIEDTKQNLFRLLGIFVKPEVEVKARRISLSELRKIIRRKEDSK